MRPAGEPYVPRHASPGVHAGCPMFAPKSGRTWGFSNSPKPDRRNIKHQCFEIPAHAAGTADTKRQPMRSRVGHLRTNSPFRIPAFTPGAPCSPRSPGERGDFRIPRSPIDAISNINVLRFPRTRPVRPPPNVSPCVHAWDACEPKSLPIPAFTPGAPCSPRRPGERGIFKFPGAP